MSSLKDQRLHYVDKKIVALLKGKYEISTIIGGIILIALAIWIVLSHYFG